MNVVTATAETVKFKEEQEKLEERHSADVREGR